MVKVRFFFRFKCNIDRFVEGRDSERLSKIGVVKLNRTWHAESSNGIPILRETRFLSERLSKIRKIKSNVAESHSNYDLLNKVDFQISAKH